MKVKRSEKPATYFGLIEPSDIFEFDDLNLYTKVKDIYTIGTNKVINAINITNGNNHYFDNTCIVIPIHGSFIENSEEIN